MSVATPRRGWLVAAYLLLAAAGAAAIPYASPAVSAAGALWSFGWAAFLVVGGVLSAAGAWRDHWLGEFIGLPLLIAVWAVFGVAAGAAVVQGRLNALPGATALLAVACLLAWRWTDRNAIRRAAREVANRRTAEDEEAP